MTSEEIAELRALLAAATPAPWEDGASSVIAKDGLNVAKFNEASFVPHKTNIALVIALRNKASAMLDAIEASDAFCKSVLATSERLDAMLGRQLELEQKTILRLEQARAEAIEECAKRCDLHAKLLAEHVDDEDDGDGDKMLIAMLDARLMEAEHLASELRRIK